YATFNKLVCRWAPVSNASPECDDLRLPVTELSSGIASDCVMARTEHSGPPRITLEPKPSPAAHKVFQTYWGSFWRAIPGQNWLAATFSPDCSAIATLDGETLAVWNTLQLTRAVRTAPMRGS